MPDNIAPLTDKINQCLRPWQEHKERINKAWLKGTTAYIETGKYLLEAKGELERDAFEALTKQELHFDPSVGRKLTCIVSNSILCAHAHILPPSWATAYELSKLDDDVLRAAIADGRVHPKMERKEAIALRKPKDEDEEEEETEPPSSKPEEKETLAAHWKRESKEARRVFLDEITVDGILAVQSESFAAHLCARLPAPKLCESDPNTIAATIFETLDAATADCVHEKLEKLLRGKPRQSNCQLDRGAFARGMGLAGQPGEKSRTVTMEPEAVDAPGAKIFRFPA